MSIKIKVPDSQKKKPSKKKATPLSPLLEKENKEVIHIQTYPHYKLALMTQAGARGQSLTQYLNDLFSDHFKQQKIDVDFFYKLIKQGNAK